MLAFAGVLQSAERPNILLILVDDLAWSDLGCYRHPWHRTPHLDRLAGQGIRYSNAYAPAPICSASRASLLTGKTTARLNFEFVTKNAAGHQQLDAPTPLRAPPFTLNLPLQEVTIAERLRDAGYETAYFGKWHLNAHHQRYLGWSPTHGPPRQGFGLAAEDFGSHPYSWGGKPQRTVDSPGTFLPDSMVNRAAAYLRRDHQRPFFLMVSHFFVHTPVKTPYRWLLEAYEQRVPATASNRERRIRYAAFVETLDHYIGEILAALEESGQAEQTLVVLTSDNGGHPEYTANGPLRGSKWNLYEGGIRVPMIARWPARIAPGTKCETPVIGYDLLPTFAQLAEADGGDVDGISIAPSFADANWRPKDRALIWHFPYYHPEKGYAKAPDEIGVDDFVVSRTRPQSAIRVGSHKLLKFYEQDQVELYDLASDISEQRDLSLEQPRLAGELSRILTSRLMEMNARFAVPSP